jgi:peptidoglycan LD-endopeptidase LytH
MPVRRVLWLAGFVLAAALFAHYCVRIVPATPDDSHGQARPAITGRAERNGEVLSIPVAGISAGQLTDTFTQARENGARRHDAIDILAPRGTAVLAAAPGRVEKLFDSDRGGHTIYIRSTQGEWIYYYAHLDGYEPGLAEGQMVKAGDQIAFVGSTGNADPSAPHLHFAVNRMTTGESWYQGTAVNPYPLLIGSR